MPDWSGDTHMQMSSRKEASVARVDQVGGSRRETVNKDRFSYEGHWFNGAHIHAGARSFSRRPFHFRRTRPKTVFFFGPACAHRLAPFSFLLFTEPWSPRSTPRPIHLHFRPSGSRPPVRDSLLRERERSRDASKRGKYDRCADMWVILAN